MARSARSTPHRRSDHPYRATLTRVEDQTFSRVGPVRTNRLPQPEANYVEETKRYRRGTAEEAGLLHITLSC